MLRRYLPVPLPFDLLLVCIATAATYYMRLEEYYGLDVIGTIPTGSAILQRHMC